MAKMTVMWTSSSFSCYLLNYMNKYLEGSIFQNHNNECFAGLIAITVGAQVYSLLGKKKAFLLGYGLAFAGGVVIYLLESGLFVLPQSCLNQFDGATVQQKRDHVLDFVVPKFIFFSKFGVALAFLFTYQASYQDDSVFPAARRASAIGQCQMIARAVTVLAPEVSEFAKPIPIACVCGVTLVALIVSLTHQGEKSNSEEKGPGHKGLGSNPTPSQQS